MDPGIGAQAGRVPGQAYPRPLKVEAPGFDRNQVESQARMLRGRERSGYAQPGSRIEQLLRLAEEQVARIVQEARLAADELHAAAIADAAELRAAAENEAAKLRAAAGREADNLRGSAEW